MLVFGRGRPSGASWSRNCLTKSRVDARTKGNVAASRRRATRLRRNRGLDLSTGSMGRRNGHQLLAHVASRE